MNRDRPRGRRALALLALASVSVTGGCAVDSTGSNRNAEISWLAPSATMRVEVEVYKGPLSKEPAVQIAELKGIVDDSDRAMRILWDNMDYSRRQMKCYMPHECAAEKQRWADCEAGGEKCDQLDEYKAAYDECVKVRTIRDFIRSDTRGYDDGNLEPEFKFTFRRDDPDSRNETQACNSLKQLFRDVDEGMRKYESVMDALPSLKSDKPVADTDMPNLVVECRFGVRGRTIRDRALLRSCEDRLRRISTYGSFLKRRAAYWAAEHVATSPVSTRLRIEMANFSQFAAEYGNQITSRADALLKQAAGAQGEAILREQLPNSTYLRDSEPTAYLNLYNWNDATVGSGRRRSAADRIRIVEHLVADNYWSHINTVFAAGQGDVSMAFVKDDVGNWNLKSFDNSPAELLAVCGRPPGWQARL